MLKRPRQSIKADHLSAYYYNHMNLPWACEDCSHFNHKNKTCTLGYVSKHHLREQQKKDYELSGKFALCRFLEID
jgi:hypothetical protein